MTEKTFLFSCAPGLEELLADELKELGAGHWEIGPGILRGQCDGAMAARLLVHSRLGSRLLLSLKTFSAKNPEMLYDQVRRIPWYEYFSPAQSFAVEVNGTVEGMAQSFAPLKIKDAICDEFRKKALERPSVDRKNPDAIILAFFNQGKCEVSLDLTGAPLHLRGYRQEGSEAPIRENKAAAFLRFCGYRGQEDLVDPFCGSGTLAIEAGLIARNIAPGLLRSPLSYRFAKLFPEGESLLREVMTKAKSEKLERAPYRIMASDISLNSVEVARSNVEKAGLKKDISVHKGNALEINIKNTLIVANPPYGERLSDQKKSQELLSDFARHVKHNCAPARLGLVLPLGEHAKAVGFKAQRKLSLKSGDIPIGFFLYELFAGARKDFLKSKSP